MPAAVVLSPDQITSSWLTRTLRASGALVHGAVEAFDAETTVRELSANVRLNLRYSPDARGDLPRRLFLKMVNLDMEEEFFGPSEVNYYTRDYLGVPDAPLIRAYDAAYSDELRRYHILLDDVSGSHVPAYTRTPTLEYGKALTEGLAVLHAHWWGRERLDRAGEQLPAAAQINRFVDLGRSGAHHILDACAGELQPHWPAAILELYDRHPPVMAERARDGSGFTLIHGDVNGGNVLVPIEGSRPLYLIDRQPFDWSLTTWLGVYDVTYAIVHRWDPDIRRRLEIPLLKHYHEHLLRRGVSGYDWEQLWYDYRLCAVMSVYVATEWCRGGVNWDTHEYWMPMLQKAMTAIDDLDCRSLWQPA